jgi:hypothetical protein
MSDQRVVRFYVSSTFRDMHAERDELVGRVFPQLRKVCEERGVLWGGVDLVDLRWAVSDEQTAERNLLPIALAEIQACRPYFIGLLGERYGWVPDEIPQELVDAEPWLAEHAGRSVTELEILHGVLRNPQGEGAFFYLRDPAYVDSLPEGEQRGFREVPSYEEIDRLGQEEAERRAIERRQRLQDLKARIRASGSAVRDNYRDPQAFGELVLNDLTEVIDKLYSGAWVFVSHSHADLAKVRRIRDALETKGHNPLLFFLKCLDDEAELDDLIRREIEARTWFILCDSPNARASRWVQEEVEIIKSLGGVRRVEVIDLDDDLDTQLERVAAQSKVATVYISYAGADEGVAEKLRAALRDRDFRVYDDRAQESIPSGSDWRASIATAIDRAVEEGTVLFLLSPEALRSQWVRYELQYAFDSRGLRSRSPNIIPIIVRDREETMDALPPEMRYAFAFDFTAVELDEGIGELIWVLVTRDTEQQESADSH